LTVLGFLQARGDHVEDWVDWINSDDNEIIATTTGGLLRVAEFEPPDLETAGSEALQSLVDHYTAILSQPGDGFSMWIDKIHLEDPSYLPQTEPNDGPRAPRLVDDCRRELFADPNYPVFRDRYYFSMHWAPISHDWFIQTIHDMPERDRREATRAFKDQSDHYLRLLSLVCPAVTVQAEHALATYLQFPLTYRWRPTPLPQFPENIAEQLANLAPWEQGDQGAKLIIDDVHVSAVEVHAFGAVTPETLVWLHERPYRYRWTTNLHCMDPGRQRRSLIADRKKWEVKKFNVGGWIAAALARDQSAARVKPDVAVVLNEIDELEATLHEHDSLAYSAMTIRTWDKDPRIAQEHAQDIASRLDQGDLICRISTFPALSAIADVPGNASGDVVNRRRPKVHVSKMARCSPLTGLTSGHREDRHLGGPALLVARSRRGGHLYIPLHSPGFDVGHVAVFGPSGGGKSFLMSTTAIQYIERYPAGTVTMLDKRYSAMVATLCAGGTHLEFGTGGIAVQPYRHIDSPERYSWAVSWTQEALKLRGVTINTRVDRAIDEALSAVRDRCNPDERTISAACAYWGAEDTSRDALAYYAGNPMFDGVVPGYGTSRWLTIEYGPLMDPNRPEGMLAFAACFHQLEHERIAVGGHPKLLIIDEAWEPLGHPLFRKWINDLALTGRKLNVQLVLCTQSVRHLDGEHTAILLEQIPNKIFTANPFAMQEGNAQRYTGIGLSDAQIQVLTTLHPKREYLFQWPHFTRIGAVEGTGMALRICGASRPSPDIDQARAILDRMKEEGVEPVGDNFLDRWLEAAA
jgi:type IV secretion system protein TrbE